MCVDMRVDMCAGMCAGMCLDMCAAMRVDVCGCDVVETCRLFRPVGFLARLVLGRRQALMLFRSADDDIGSISASPTACPLRGYGRAGTQNDRLGEALIFSTRHAHTRAMGMPSAMPSRTCSDMPAPLARLVLWRRQALILFRSADEDADDDEEYFIDTSFPVGHVHGP